MKIESMDQFKELLEKESRFFFMKHSLTCPISGNAFQEFNSFLQDSDAKGYYLAVQEARELSSQIADEFQIKHESPQVFLIENGKPVWHASHWNITKKELDKLLSK
ncbi:bacillithiol system redox-active protein YtxJ [Falsibacillus pallidus]|uniref:bacillithiol system redox-active protein YtxJ n=1 Tax=Falsibacillus pallidus TaxID=493781 RepID=UPI003D96CAE0